MSSIKNQKIGGDASVGRNVAMGGNGRIAGSLIIGHNLQVKGWLEAPNIKDTNKGVFASVESLNAAYPSPRDGWFAGVGESTPFDLYVAESGAWVATGGELDVEVDIDYYNGEIERIDGDIHDLTDDVSANSEAIEQHDGLIEGHTQQIAEITETLTEVQQTATAAKEQSESNADSIGEHTEQLTSLSSTVSANSQSIAGHAQQIEQISGTLAETRETADEAKYQSNANAVNISRVNALVGYYECSTLSSVSAKTITVNSFSRIVGGCMHVKMHFTNTASSATLNINGTGAIALYYNGKHVSARNTWEDDEIVVVFFDGDEYQAFPVGAKYIEQQSVPQPSQPEDFPELEELEERVGSLERAAAQHNVLPFDSTVYPSVTPSDTLYEHTIQPREAFEYSICLIPVLGSVRFCLKVGNDYYNSWSIKKQFSSDGLIPVGQGSIDDPYSVPSGTYTEEISNNDWYSGELHNKVFYNRSNKVVYAYNCETKSLEAITNIQVVEENAPTPESTSNPNNSTKGSIVVDLENDKLLTWDGNKWKALSGGGGQTVVVQSNEDSPSIVRLDTNTSKLGKKVIPLGTSAANLFKNGVRENDSDVYNSTTYSSDDGTYTVYHIKYEFDLNSSSVTVPEKSILKFEGGCLKNGTLVGNNTKVEVDGTYTIFDNMSFSGTFRDSNLYATNFGAIGNMVSVSKTLTFKNLVDESINERTRLVNGADELNYSMAAGTESHDYTAFSKLCQFLSGSSNIHITLNGEFYVAKILVGNTGYTSEVSINSADNLTIEGGTTTAAWQIKDCNNVTLLNTNYVGFHEIHKFPNIATSVGGSYTENNNTINYSDVCVTYIDASPNSAFGLANPIRFLPADSATPLTTANIDTYDYADGLTINNCHFEMRSYGVILGNSIKASSTAPITGLRAVRNCAIENCTFDHIKCQVFSLHGVNNTKLNNCSINYCSCPIDIGTGCTNMTIENIIARHCAIGIKEAMMLVNGEVFPSGNNIISNCNITIDDEYPYKRSTTDDYYILRFIGESSNDYFKVENSSFTVNRQESPIGDKGRSYMTNAIRIEANVEFNNCTFSFGNVACLFRGLENSYFGANFNNCRIAIENDTELSSIFLNINNVNISSSIIDYKDNGEAAKGVGFSSEVSYLNIANSEIYFRKGTSMGMALSANTVFKQNKITYNNSNGSYCFVLEPNTVIDNNTFDINNGIALFTVNETNNSDTISNIKINNNLINTSCGVISMARGNIEGVEIKNNIINYTGDATSTKGILHLDKSTDITIDGNVFKGSAARKISDVPLTNTRIIGSLLNPSVKGAFIDIPDISKVNDWYLYYDTTKGRILMSNGTDWVNIGSEVVVSTQNSTLSGDTYPDNPQKGTAFYHTGGNNISAGLYYYDGSDWSPVTITIIPNEVGGGYPRASDVGAGYVFRSRVTMNYYVSTGVSNAWITLSELTIQGYYPSSAFISARNTDNNDAMQAAIKTTVNSQEVTTFVDEGKVYFDTTNCVLKVSSNAGGIYWIDVDLKHVPLESGAYSDAPSPNNVVSGFTYYDTTYDRMLISDGIDWLDFNGNTIISKVTRGTTAQRPEATNVTEGFKYYNTEIHKEQMYNGTTWVDVEDVASAEVRANSLIPDVVTGSALNNTLTAEVNKYYRYDTAVDDLTVTLPELVSSSKVQNVVVYLTAGSNADSTTITFEAATPTEGTAAPVYYQKSYDIEAGKTYEINALYNGAAWIVAAVEIITAVAQSSNSSNNSLLMGGVTPEDNTEDTASTDVQPENTEDI